MRNKYSANFLSKIVKEHSDMILRIAFQYLKNQADAEDIMQDVFLSLLTQNKKFTKDHLKHWLIVVTTNKCKNFLNSAAKKKTTSLEYDFPFNDQDRYVLEALSKIPESDQTVIYLFYYEGYSAKEIASILNKKEDAIYAQLSRARSRLKPFLEE